MMDYEGQWHRSRAVKIDQKLCLNIPSKKNKEYLYLRIMSMMHIRIWGLSISQTARQ